MVIIVKSNLKIVKGEKMSRKVFTLEIKDEVQAKSEPAKKVSTNSEKKSAGFEFGVSEINNSSAKKRVTQKTILGYEKNVCSASKKPVKAKVEEVDDYFDFCFKKPVKTADLKANVEEIKPKSMISDELIERLTEEKVVKTTTKKPVTKKTTTKAETAKKEPAKKEPAKKVATKKTTSKAETTKKSAKIKEVVKDEVVKTEIEKFEEVLDDDALRVVSVARIGSLFD